jgi:hypothetical protein
MMIWIEWNGMELNASCGTVCVEDKEDNEVMLR